MRAPSVLVSKAKSDCRPDFPWTGSLRPDKMSTYEKIEDFLSVNG